MSLIAETRERLRAAGLAPNHRLGQHFMIDRSALQCLVEQAGETPSLVVEIGSGTGLLTDGLLAAGHRVVAVELDHGLAALLQQRFVGRSDLTLIEGDALASKNQLHPDLIASLDAPWRLVANLPYDISIPVILNALQRPRPPEHIAVTVQYEAAARLCAAPGDAAWGASAAVARAAGSGDIIRRLPPGCFYPRPRVDSAILVWRPERVVPAAFGVWCRRLFAYRRKVLRRGLRDAGCSREQVDLICQQAKVSAQARVETIDVSDLLRLWEVLSCET